MTTRPSLAGRAVLALLLMLGFYGLALGLAGGLLLIVWLDLAYASRVPIKFLFLCVASAGLILWSIAPRIDRFIPPGPRLLPDEHPRLFQELWGIAQAVGQSMPAEVYIVLDVNAWVTQRGGLMGVGSRRVMGLGLPLLQALTVSQFRAVLAHEFGHYHGGDTRLGPWVYKTRAALMRTVRVLHEHESVLRHPFVWYGEMFLRVTHGVSRAQELAADELSARTVGSRPLAEGLQIIHGAGPAFSGYMGSEFVPTMRAGFRPSLTEGFQRFLAAAAVAESLKKGLETTMAGVQSDPYDTHPPLPERLANIRSLAPGARVASDPPAASLLNNLSRLEADALVMATNDPQVRALPQVDWDDTTSRVWIPAWESACRGRAAVLRAYTPGVFPTSTQELARMGELFAGTEAPGHDAPRLALFSLGGAFSLALRAHGWTLDASPGAEVTARRGDMVIEPFRVIHSLAAGELTADAWQTQCAVYGIVDLDLGAVATN
jgi:heat shock protein HtpX